MTTACQTVTVTAPGTIAGKVTDGATGAGIPATVMIKTTTPVPGIVVASQNTDSGGNYSIGGLSPGTYQVAVQSISGLYIPVTALNVTVIAGATTTVNVQMYTPAAITAITITVTPMSCLAPCDVTATITWTNQGETNGTYTPGVSIDGGAPQTLAAENLNAGASITHTFSITGLAAGSHTICPVPN